MSTSGAMHIHAELLAHIRQVSVVVSLPSPSTRETRASISDDRKTLSILHGAHATTFLLPAQIAPLPQLPQFPPGASEMSWRLPAADLPARPLAEDLLQTRSAPWSAKDLTPSVDVLCRKCAAVLIPAGKIGLWKDLPSENWAEMMDFWHCHKPVDTNQEPKVHDPASDRGYGANSKFTARAATGFVDLTSMLLAKEDCPGVTQYTKSALQDTVSSVSCEGCSASLGFEDLQAEGVRLLKWNMSLSSRSVPSAPPEYPASMFLGAMILSKISSQATRKFNLISSSPTSHSSSLPKYQQPILRLWILSTGIRYNSNSEGPTKPRLALKVYYRSIYDYKPDDRMSNDIEDLILPTEPLHELERSLARSTENLPPRARQFGEWHIGFLDRYEDDLCVT